MTRRQKIFLVVLALMLLAIFWMLRIGGEGARTREAIKAVPTRISNLNVPMSAAWDANFQLPATNAELERYGTPVGGLGAQADGTVLNVSANGVVEVTVKAQGNDQEPGRLSYFPVIDLTTRAPSDLRVKAWRCISDNLPLISQILPECSHVDASQRAAALAAHEVQLARAAEVFRPVEPETTEVEPQTEGDAAADPAAQTVPGFVPAPSGATVSATSIPAVPNAPGEPLQNGPSISLTPLEVDRALRNGQSLEQALEDKRRSAGLR